MLILGVLLFPVAAGKFPYYEKGIYGLLFFILALQTVTLGEPPFDNMGKSKPLLGERISLVLPEGADFLLPPLFCPPLSQTTPHEAFPSICCIVA